MGQTGFCENLRFPAVFSENLRQFPGKAKICAPHPNVAMVGDHGVKLAADLGGRFRSEKKYLAPPFSPPRAEKNKKYPKCPPSPTQRTLTYKKKTTTMAKIVNYDAVVLLLRPPNLPRRGPFFERKNVCNSRKMVSARRALR